MEEGKKPKKGMFACYGEMWKRAFDFKGLSTVREFWLAFFANVLVILLLGIVLIFWLFSSWTDNLPLSIYFIGWTVLGVLFVLYLPLSIVPFTALAVRRLHDSGRSGWWVILVYFLVGFALCVTVGCLVEEHAIGLLYGPPEFDEEDNRNVTMYGPPSMEEEPREWKEEDNINVDVYGPPEWFE